MPTLIDELVVKLNLDTTQLRAESQKAQDATKRVVDQAQRDGRTLEDGAGKFHDLQLRRSKDMEQVAKGASNQLTRFRNEIIGLLAVMAGASSIQQFVRNITTTDAATGRLAKNIGMSTEELAKWQGAARRAGGSAEATGGSFRGLVQQFQQFAITGQSAVIPYFRTLGVQVADAAGEMRPIRDIMLELADKFSTMTPARAQAFGAAIGLDEGTINLLIQGRKAVEALLDQQGRLGTATDESARVAIRWQNAWMNAKDALEGLGRVILVEVLPPLTKFIEEVARWLSNPENREWIKAKTIEGMRLIGEYLTKGQQLFHEWQTAAEVLAIYLAGAWATSMLATLGAGGPVMLALAAILAAFVAIKKASEPLDPSSYSPDSPLWQGIPEEQQLRYENSPASRLRRGEGGKNPNQLRWWNPGSWFDKPMGGLASTDLNEVQRGFLNTIAGPESGGDYSILNGAVDHVAPGGDHPNRIGTNGSSTAYGRYQITYGTWQQYASKLGMEHDTSPKNQDAVAWLIATDRYRKNTGRDLEDDLRSGGHADLIARALGPTWSSLPGGKESQMSSETFAEALKRNSQNQLVPRSGLGDELNGGKPLINRLKDWGNRLTSPAVTPPPPPPPDKVSSNTNSTNFNGPINVYTQATDGQGLVRSLDQTARRYAFQSNTGLA